MAHACSQENANSYGMLILRPIQKLLTNATDGEITILPDEADLQGLTSGVVRIKDLVDVVSTETRTKSMQVRRCLSPTPGPRTPPVGLAFDLPGRVRQASRGIAVVAPVAPRSGVEKLNQVVDPSPGGVLPVPHSSTSSTYPPPSAFPVA